MYTLGQTTPPAIAAIEESYAINHAFVCDEVLPKGTAVKLLPTGKVAKTEAASDTPIGYVTVANKAAEEKVTVATTFLAVLNVTADGAVAVGDPVYGSGTHTDGNGVKTPQYKVAVDGDNVTGVALTAGADNATIGVGIFRVPYVLVSAES